MYFYLLMKKDFILLLLLLLLRNPYVDYHVININEED